MHMVMYYYIHTYVYTYIHFHWKEHYHANERQMVSHSNYALPVSTTLLRRWYYVNAVPSTLVLRQSGSYYVVTRSLLWPLRSYYVNCKHVQNLTTS